MSTIYPDVNKYKANDTELCWAAAASNALVWTGWNQAMAQASGGSVLTEEEIYDYFRNYSFKGMTDDGWFVLPAIRWILSEFKVDVDYMRVAQYRSPHDLFLSVPAFNTNGRTCALFDLYLDEIYGSYSGHVITVYRTYPQTAPSHKENDPRIVQSFLFCDSDDHVGAQRDIHQSQTIDFIAYSPSFRSFVLRYAGKLYHLARWCSVSPFQGAHFN